MSEQQISKLHANLATLQGETARQKAAAKHILDSAEKMLEGVDKRLADIHPMTDGDEYQRLLQERGVLQQVNQQAHSSSPQSDGNPP
jgi:hypothetical protein